MMSLLILISCFAFTIIAHISTWPEVFGRELLIRYPGGQWIHPGMELDVQGTVKTFL
jgi:hypothetical protein